MYKFLITHLPKMLANIVIALWYFILILLNIYCGISAARVSIRRVVIPKKTFLTARINGIFIETTWLWV
jgi:hypothetical protein